MRRLTPAKNKDFELICTWAAREINLGVQNGILHSSCGMTCQLELGKMRGLYAGLLDQFDRSARPSRTRHLLSPVA